MPANPRSARRAGAANDRSSGRRSKTPAPKNSNATLFVVIAAVVVIGAGAWFVLGNKKTEEKPADTTAEKVEVPAPIETPKKEVPAKINWDQYVSKVDMTQWTKIENYIVEAIKLKVDAETARAAGDEATFKSTITLAMAEFQKASRGYEDWQVDVNRIKDGLFDAKFKSQDAKMAKWTREFRQYLNFMK